jgi:hypothetical protein
MIDRRTMLLVLAGCAGARSALAQRQPHSSAQDLQGLWTTASYTDLERPPELARLVLTPQEAEAYEAPRRALNGRLPSRPEELGQAEGAWSDRGSGLARVRGEIRSSWIVDPPDGRIPFTAAARARLKLDAPRQINGLEGPEQMSGPERCLAAVSAGAPMTGAPDANHFEILQAPGFVVIHSEKYHDARVIALRDTHGGQPMPPSWLGESTGRWEGDALVVTTTGLRPGITHRGQRLYLSGASRVIEWFTRSSPRELLYRFEVEDPELFSRRWRGEMAIQAATGRIYEYACHEGNYALPGILGGARREERDAAGR